MTYFNCASAVTTKFNMPWNPRLLLLYSVILPVLVWTYCTPANADKLHVVGLPIPFTQAQVHSSVRVDDRLVLQLVEEGRSYDIEIFPWPEDVTVPACRYCVLRGEVEGSVSGVSHRLELTRGGVTSLVIGSNQRLGSMVLPGWTLRKNSTERASADENQTVARLEIQGSTKTLNAAPGQVVTITNQGRDWSLHILHFMQPRAEQRSVPEAMDSGNPMATRPEVAHEQETFSADWILLPGVSSQ